MVFTLGGASVPVISGFIADHFNYSFVWIIYFLLTIVYLILILMALKRKKPQINSEVSLFLIK